MRPAAARSIHALDNPIDNGPGDRMGHGAEEEAPGLLPMCQPRPGSSNRS
jgi:hypothetical protein